MITYKWGTLVPLEAYENMYFILLSIDIAELNYHTFNSLYDIIKHDNKGFSTDSVVGEQMMTHHWLTDQVFEIVTI